MWNSTAPHARHARLDSLDTSNVSSRFETWRDEPSGIWAVSWTNMQGAVVEGRITKNRGMLNDWRIHNGVAECGPLRIWLAVSKQESGGTFTKQCSSTLPTSTSSLCCLTTSQPTTYTVSLPSRRDTSRHHAVHRPSLGPRPLPWSKGPTSKGKGEGRGMGREGREREGERGLSHFLK